jgi:hypothetical protein
MPKSALRFSDANNKIKALAHYGAVYSFDLSAGKSCPFAQDCKSEVIVVKGKKTIKDGADCQYRCFAASLEVIFPNVYALHKRNFDILQGLKSVRCMYNAISKALPDNASIVRVHSSGDFFNETYFNAWVRVAMANPHILFYAYTKAISFWLKNIKGIPDNFILTASYGGTQDYLIKPYNLRSARVVFSESEANILGLPIDHTDEYAALPEYRNTNFAVLLHGIQPANSRASQAIKDMKKQGVKFSYSGKK